MSRQPILFLLAMGLWAQTSTAWKWHGYGENNFSNYCTPVFNTGNGRMGTIRVLGDTVYIMGTYLKSGPFSSPLPLPKVPGDPANPDVNANLPLLRSTYLAAYDRQTGHILWWMSFTPTNSNSNGFVEGQDFVARPDGKIYLLLHTNAASAGFEWDYQSASGSSSNSSFDINSFFTSILPTNRVSSILEIDAVSPPSVQVRGAIGVTDVPGEVHLKYLYYWQDTLYVTGDYIVQGTGFWALSDVSGSALFYKNALNNNTSSSNEWRGLIIGYKTGGSWTLIRAAEVRYESGVNYDPVKGHRLARDPVTGRLRWVIEVERTDSRPLIYNQNPGGLGSSLPISFSSPVVTLYALSLKSDLSLPPPPNYHELAQKNGTGITPEEIFLRAYGDSILWLRSVNYAINITNGSSSSYYSLNTPPYILVVRQQLSSTGNYAATLSYQGISELNTGLPFAPHLVDVAAERGWDLLYLMGKAYKASGAAGDLLNMPNNRDSGFLLGLRYKGGSYQVMGGRAFFSLSSDPFLKEVEVIGGAYDSLRAQFYLMGTAEDSLWVQRLWPMGTHDTVRVCTIMGSSGLWLGCLDWYRLTTAGSFAQCVPDTLTSSFTVQVSGKNVHNSDIPPGVPAGWLFYWSPMGTRLKTLAGRLDLIGPLMGNQEGIYNYGFPLIAKGAFQGGDYMLCGSVVPVLRDLPADLIDTVKLTVTGTTLPAVGRGTQSARTFMVVPYAGVEGNSIPLISGPYPRYRQENWQFPSLVRLYYLPFYRGEETVLITQASPSARVWGLHLRTGWVDSLPAPTGPIIRFFPDPVRQTYWVIRRVSTIPLSYSLQRAPFDTLSFLITQGIQQVRVSRNAYPLRYDSIWVRWISHAAVLSDGGVVFAGQSYPAPFSTSLWRVSLARDSVFRVTAASSGCPQDGFGSGAVIKTPYTDLAVEADTIYWIEKIPYPSCIANDTTYILRRAYPSSGSISALSYTVETIDTIRILSSSDGIRDYLIYVPEPRPGLIFGSWKGGIIWYDLGTRERDTLVRCRERAPGLCCKYGLSDWINQGTLWDAVRLRGGALAIASGNGSINIAVPIAVAGQRDTLVAEAHISSGSIAGGNTALSPSMAQDTLTFAWPAPSGAVLDSTYLRIGITPCTGGKPFFYPFHYLPVFTLSLRGPDTVCLGEIFHTYVGRDTEVVINTCRVSHRLWRPVTSAQGKLTSIMGGNEVMRWRATAAGYDTITAAIQDPKWSYLVQPDTASLPIRVREGYRLRLRTALEGPYNSATFLHQKHPLLNRYNIAAYNQRILGISPDSLWRLPYSPGDSIMKTWNSAPIDPIGPCPGTGTWYCDTIWTTLAKVELRDAPTGPVVDSAYALVDTEGVLTYYRAPLSSRTFPVGSGDTLHFCHCDPTTPKYLTVRFPNHLPLHTPLLSLSPRGVGEADSIDLRDPTYLEGIPGEHYTFLPGPGGTLRAAAWAGNCADEQNSFIPGGAHVDAGWINAADYDFVINRNGVVSGFSIADLNSDGVVNALDATIVIENQNHLRQSSRP